MKHNTVASFHEIKGRFSARKRRALAITETLETSEEGSLDIDFMKATNNIKSTFCQPCTIYRTEINCRLTEKDELIKTLNIFREQTNQLILHYPNDFLAIFKFLTLNIFREQTNQLILHFQSSVTF